MPQCYEDDRADKRSNNGDTLDVDVADARDYDDMSHQPDADNCCNDCTDEAERYSPTDDGFRDKANNGCNYQVNDKAKADSPGIVANLVGHAIPNYCTENQKM